MAKNTLFLCDAMSAVGLACLNQLPKNFRVQAWTNKAASWLPKLNDKITLSSVSLDALSILPAEARSATHVVFSSDCFFRAADVNWLNAWADVIKRAYDACDDDSTKAFVFISSASVYDDSELPVTEFSSLAPSSVAKQTAVDIEKYLLNASADRKLKPIILRIATPYGPRCASLPYAIFQQIAFLATLRTNIPRFYKGPRCPLVHVEDVAAAIYYLMDYGFLDEQLFNLADDDCLRVGEIVDVARQASHMPEHSTFLLPHALSLPLVFRTLSNLGILNPLSRIAERAWKRVCFCYGLDAAPAPNLADFVTATAWPKINSDRLKSLGFELRHASFRTSAQALYDSLCEDHWLPNLDKPPCRPDALFNRVFFQQSWRGFIVDQASPNDSQNITLTIDNDMPIWATHSFSNAPLRGSFYFGEHLRVDIEGVRKVRHLMDVCSISTASFNITLAQRKLSFRPDVSGMNFFAPYQKFSLVDDSGRVRYTGKLTLDLSLTTVKNSLKNLKFSE